MKQLIKLIVFVAFVIFPDLIFSQNYDEIIFSDFKNYASKLDSIKSNSDLIIIRESKYNPDDFDFSSFILPFSFFSPVQNKLFTFNANFFGIPQTKSEFYFENVNLSDNFFGGYDLSNLPRIFIDKLIIDKVQNNALSGANSLSSSVFTEFSKENDNNLNLHFHGGNFYGSSAAKYNGNIDNYYWNTGFAYKNSAGYNYPDSGEQIDLLNSQQEKAAAFAKVGIKDNNSDISFSFTHIDNNRGIPQNFFTTQNDFYLQESEWKSDLFNFRFDTRINNNFIAKGNFYYYKYKRIIDNFDNEKFNSQATENSFRNISDDYKFGANLEAELNNQFLKNYSLFLNYERTLYKNQANFGLPIMKTETEHLTFGFAKNFIDLDEIKLSFNSKYHLFNLIFSDFRNTNISENYGDAALSFTFLHNDEFVFNADINYSSKIPEVALLVDSLKNFKDIEQSINSEISIKWLPNSFFQISSSLFYSKLIDAIYYSDLFFSRQDANYYNDNVYGFNSILNLNYFNYNLQLDYKYLISLENIYYFSPQNQLNLTLSKHYKYGFSWLIHLNYSGERRFREEYPILTSYSILNVRLSQMIQNKYEVYLRLDNAFEEYFEYFPGTPQPGRLFSAGVKISMGI